MPPPAFTSSSAASDKPSKALLAGIKDTMQRVRTALVAESAPISPALQSIDLLVSESGLPTSGGATALSESGSSGSIAAGQSQHLAAASLQNQLSAKLNSELLDIFSDEMDQNDLTKISSLIEILSRLAPLLGPACIVMEWWDLVLRPSLKNPSLHSSAAARARELVMQAMASSPSTAYKDEPPPKASWPHVSGSEQPTTRKAGDAPYPLASAAPHSPVTPRKSSNAPDHGASPTSSGAPRKDMFRQFTQRIFDLYLSESSAGYLKHHSGDEDDDHESEEGGAAGQTIADCPKEPAQMQREKSHDSEVAQEQLLEEEEQQGRPIDLVGTTWRGNLEAILLMFGQSRPKVSTSLVAHGIFRADADLALHIQEFFHHLAESFAEAAARVPVLVLLTIFLRLNSNHTYHITSTALPRQLLLSLQLDTSTTSTSLCITALVMLMPHIPNWLANGGAGGLPTLLSVYARVVDWRKLGKGWEERVGDSEEMEALRKEKDEEFAEVARLGKRLCVRPGLNWQRLGKFRGPLAQSRPARFSLTLEYPLYARSQTLRSIPPLRLRQTRFSSLPSCMASSLATRFASFERRSTICGKQASTAPSWVTGRK